MTASSAFLTYGTIPLGALLGGWPAAFFDPRTAMWITTAGVRSPRPVLVFSPVRSARDLPTAPPTEEPAVGAPLVGGHPEQRTA